MDRQEISVRCNEQVQRDCKRANSMPGVLNTDHVDANGNTILADGIDCPMCLNRGYSYVISTNSRGESALYCKPCECLPQRMSVRRMRESGLEKVVQKYTFDTFKTDADWQRKMKDRAMKYLREGVKNGAWLYVGGQSGAGKTHLCTAVAGVILRKLDLHYTVWPRMAQQAKAVVNDAEAYAEIVEPQQKVRVLYIDDLFKPSFNRDGSECLASGADVRLAFDILNYRYVNSLPTIISSEWFSAELVKIDEAVAGRIIEMAGEFKMDIRRDPGRNFRTKDEPI